MPTPAANESRWWHNPEKIEGQPLADLSPAEIWPLVRSVLAGLIEIHINARVIHRNINLLNLREVDGRIIITGWEWAIDATSRLPLTPAAPWIKTHHDNDMYQLASTLLQKLGTEEIKEYAAEFMVLKYLTTTGLTPDQVFILLDIKHFKPKRFRNWAKGLEHEVKGFGSLNGPISKTTCMQVLNHSPSFKEHIDDYENPNMFAVILMGYWDTAHVTEISVELIQKFYAKRKYRK